MDIVYKAEKDGHTVQYISFGHESSASWTIKKNREANILKLENMITKCIREDNASLAQHYIQVLDDYIDVIRKHRELRL